MGYIQRERIAAFSGSSPSHNVITLIFDGFFHLFQCHAILIIGDLDGPGFQIDRPFRPDSLQGTFDGIDAVTTGHPFHM